MQISRSGKILGGIALAGAMAVAGVSGFAQQATTQEQSGQARVGRDGRRGGHRGMRRGGMMRFSQNLNLTDAQREQMQQISARHRESTRALHEQVRAAGGRGSRASAFDGGAFDEAAVRAAAQARASVHVEMEVARARMMSEMYNVLTPEQRAQLAAERQQREQRRQERRARRNANATQNQQ